MSLSKPRRGSQANMDPGSGGTSVTGPKMMSTTAKDDPETVKSSNPQKQFTGSGKKPSGPYGVQGREF